MRKTIKRNRYSRRRKTYKGSGLASSKPLQISSQYPELPESPTNRPIIGTQNENLAAITGNNRKKRLLPLAKRIVNARNPSFINRLFGRKKPVPPINTYGNIKSAFSINKKPVGFKP